MLITGIIIVAAAIAACYSPQLVDRFWISWLPVCLYIAYINPRLRLIGILISCFLWTTAVIYWQLDHRLAFNHNNKRLVAVGEVLNIPKSSSTSTNFLFKPLSIAGYEGKYPNKIRLNWRNAPEQLAPGQVWKLLLKIKRPHGFQNPGGFDYERWMFVRGIHASGYVVKSELNKLQNSRRTSLNSIRFEIKQHIEKYCFDCKNSGLIEALAIGYRGSISQQTRSLLSQTGTAHLIAVSGLHIGIVSSVFYALGMWLWSGFVYSTGMKRKEFALLLAWAGGLSYSLLSGFDLPAQRAMLMLTVLVISLFIRSPFNLLHSINTALVLVVIIFPLSVLSESFWLTFSALMIIAFGAFILQQQPSRFKQLLIIQLLFSILFIPLSIFIFGQIHSASIAANLIAVPFISFIIVPLNFILLMLFWLPDQILQYLYGLLDNLLEVLMLYLNGLQNNGFRAIEVAEIEGWKLILILLFMILLLIPRGFISKVIALFLLPPLLFWNQNQLNTKKLKMTVLDVGMGTAIILQTSNHSLIYDFGPGNKKGYSLGLWAVLPYMQYEGIEKPHKIVISHADQDHSGGFYALQQKYLGIPVFSGTVAELQKKFPGLNGIKDCHDTDSWMWDGVKFEFLGKQPEQTNSENNRSCVLKVSLKQNSLLLTGDIELKQEIQLINEDNNSLKSTILVAPHHGSTTSSSVAFINAVEAESVIFTTGYFNRWKFPRLKIIQKYAQTGADTMQTDKTGSIQVVCDEIECKLEKFRQRQPRLWY